MIENAGISTDKVVPVSILVFVLYLMLHRLQVRLVNIKVVVDAVILTDTYHATFLVPFRTYQFFYATTHASIPYHISQSVSQLEKIFDSIQSCHCLKIFPQGCFVLD